MVTITALILVLAVVLLSERYSTALPINKVSYPLDEGKHLPMLKANDYVEVAIIVPVYYVTMQVLNYTYIHVW